MKETGAAEELREFPEGASEWVDAPSRRKFLSLSAASLALAGIGACTRQPRETIVPYVDPPEEILPGRPSYFATATHLRGIATGILVESHMGRPTKVEGNPEHPASRGATDIFGQSSVLGLYDPDRSQVVVNAGRIDTWESFVSALEPALERQRGKNGAGLRLLTGTVTSPTVARQIRDLLARFPEARWHVYEAVPRDAVWQGTEQAFGKKLEPRFRFEAADAVLSLDADFLSPGPGQLVYTRELTARRRPEHPRGLNRLYVVEPVPSLAGALADHRLAVRDSEVSSFARRVAAELGLEVTAGSLREAVETWARAIAADLAEHRGRSLVLAGEGQPAVVHALAHAMNHALGNVGATVEYTEPIAVFPEDYTGSVDSLRDLVVDMERGAAELVVMVDVNPVYDAPADLGFAEALSKVRLRLHLGLHDDETAALCHWHIPQAHELESWGDGRSFDGTVTFNQPLIAPLYGGKTASELLAALLGHPGRSAYELLRESWRASVEAAEFERFWRQAIHDGFIKGSAFEPRPVALQPRAFLVDAEAPTESLEVIFRPDPTVFDGRFANNGWLQELPKPLTKLTWDNAVLLSPRTAERLGVENEEFVELGLDGRDLRAPIWILPGQAEDVVCLHLGYGRTRAGRGGTGAGFDANQLRTTSSFWRGSLASFAKTGRSYALAQTQTHHRMEGRGLVREASFDDYERNPGFAHEAHHDPSPAESLHPPVNDVGDYSWGMSIDLGRCTGCNACVVACQSENNIPVVGKDQVRAGREMQWIRVDRYFEGDFERPRIRHQPVNCMHCENAPCEVVCPVSATVHTPEGLNAMVYNRCVGTRYCSNNCPYKVRRFNFLLYADFETPVLSLLNNPDVTVRSRGVMEKCTYCVQRVNAARIEAKKEGRAIRDGEVVTACQQVCPAEAIVFGDKRNPDSRVSKEKSNPRSYAILSELGTRPRTTYIAKVRNPNPGLQEVG
jgi:molybdopterin-containing oxidoreductase family iron-sulfur binding subunit